MVEDESISDSAISDDEQTPVSRPSQQFTTDSENNLTCCILMIDILLKQMELQDIEQHQGINTSVCENVCRLLKCMVTATAGIKAMGPGTGGHICSEKLECQICEASVMWHQLATKIVQFMAPRVSSRVLKCPQMLYSPFSPSLFVEPSKTARCKSARL